MTLVSDVSVGSGFGSRVVYVASFLLNVCILDAKVRVRTLLCERFN